MGKLQDKLSQYCSTHEQWDIIQRIDMTKLNEDLYGVLMDKTEGEAYARVKAVTQGMGLEAYVKLYKWFMGTTGLGLTERARAVMSPTPPKSERDIAEALDKWVEMERIVSSHKGYELSTRLKMTALKMLMVGRAKDHFEQWEAEYKEDDPEGYKVLLDKIMEYATRRRLEANMARGKDAMDIGGVDGGRDEQGEAGDDSWWEHEQWDPWSSWGNQDFDPSQAGGIHALGKGENVDAI